MPALLLGLSVLACVMLNRNAELVRLIVNRKTWLPWHLEDADHLLEADGFRNAVLFSIGIAVDADRSDQSVLHHLNLRKHVAVAGNKDCTDVAYFAEDQSPEDVDKDPV